MSRRMSRGVLGAMLLLAIGSGVAESATLNVANNGVDNNFCGAADSPCRSISQAIANATNGDTVLVGPGRYGDLNGDGRLGGPGEEAGPADCACMIEVKKQLTLQSRDGAGATILDASVAGLDGVVAVVIRADGVVFGMPRHGFLITNARRSGLTVQANGVTVAGNVAIGNGANGNKAFDIQGTGNTVSDNVAVNNPNVGFGISGDGVIATGNVASDNLEGFDVSFSGQFTDNVASGNRFHGLVVNANNTKVLEIHRNAVLGNRNLGIRVFHSNVTITENNIFGNDGIGSNCGLDNNTGSSLTASRNFWGATTGPGPDPADAVCNEVGSTTIVDPFASRPFHMKVEAGR